MKVFDVMHQPGWEGLWGRMAACIWLSPFALHLKLPPTLLIGYTPVQNKMFKL